MFPKATHNNMGHFCTIAKKKYYCKAIWSVKVSLNYSDSLRLYICDWNFILSELCMVSNLKLGYKQTLRWCFNLVDAACLKQVRPLLHQSSSLLPHLLRQWE